MTRDPGARCRDRQGFRPNGPCPQVRQEIILAVWLTWGYKWSEEVYTNPSFEVSIGVNL